MGLDIGIIRIEYLDRPQGFAYDFAWELAIHASSYGYMHGEGNNWGYFTQLQVLRMLDTFATEHKLRTRQQAEIIAWLRSLPWDGWRDDLTIAEARSQQDEDEDEYPVVDHDPDRDGGLIELHFNW